MDYYNGFWILNQRELYQIVVDQSNGKAYNQKVLLMFRLFL